MSAIVLRHQLKSVNSGLNFVPTGGNVSLTRSFYQSVQPLCRFLSG